MTAHLQLKELVYSGGAVYSVKTPGSRGVGRKHYRLSRLSHNDGISAEIH